MESNGKTSLTARQLKFIPHLLTCRSIEEACRKARVSKPTVYAWLKEDAFSVEVQKQKDLIYGRAIDNLSSGTDAAVKKLMRLVNSRNENIALRAALSILTLAIRAKETEASESPRAGEHQRATGIFTSDIVQAAWNRDEKERAEMRKEEMKPPLSHKR